MVHVDDMYRVVRLTTIAHDTNGDMTMAYDSFLVLHDADTTALVNDIMFYMRTERGIHTVELTRSRAASDTDIKRILYSGTPKAVQRIKRMARLTRVYLPENSDHDHDACIRSAQSMGVPAAYAHTPETYLSM